MENEENLRVLIREELDNYMKNELMELVKHFSTVLTNENGNSSVKQSGNGFVYVDNTGIAYALTLFFYHFMSNENQQNINLDGILARLDEHISDNRKMFEDTMQSLTDDES